MKLLWTVKLYTTGGMNKPYRVRVTGNPTGRPDVPWINAGGVGQTPGEALNAAAEQMKPEQQRAFLKFLDNSEPVI